MATDFLPEGYETPETNANYMKFEEGENKFRVLSSPIVGWLDFKDNKPMRFKMKEKPSAPVDAKKPIKHFWAMVVYNYQKQAVQVLEITQNSIQKAIESYSRDEDYGHPKNYDIVVTRKGSGKETEYTVKPKPPKPITNEITIAQVEKGDINLDALYEGKDPFATNA